MTSIWDKPGDHKPKKPSLKDILIGHKLHLRGYGECVVSGKSGKAIRVILPNGKTQAFGIRRILEELERQ